MSEIELDYVEERGPGIVELPEGGAEESREAEVDGRAAVLPAYPGWDQEAVEQFLRGTGAGIHMLIGAAERDWLMTEKDLERIAPPLTRICNRWEPALRLSPLADPLLVAHGFALYGWRSALERQRALRDEEIAQESAPGARYERPPEEPEPSRGDRPERDPGEEPETYFPRGAASDDGQ